MSKETGGSIFPSKELLSWDTDSQNNIEEDWRETEGLTKRDYFAAKAMHAMVSDPETLDAIVAQSKKSVLNPDQIIARNSVQIADALIMELGE